MIEIKMSLLLSTATSPPNFLSIALLFFFTCLVLTHPPLHRVRQDFADIDLSDATEITPTSSVTARRRGHHQVLRKEWPPQVVEFIWVIVVMGHTAWQVTYMTGDR